MTARNPLNRTLADGIQRVGFRKWYERELLSSHAHMALALLASVALIASFEAFQGGSWSEKLLDTGFVLACAAIALWALRRYLYLLMHAELEAVICGGRPKGAHHTYALVEERAPAAREPGSSCSREWRTRPASHCAPRTAATPSHPGSGNWWIFRT